jgi:sigma-B regulation protein RsbU (phosphoserine phosphatase)
MQIVIADDDKFNRRLLVNCLKESKHNPIEVSDGIQAWEVLEKYPETQLLITDWLMPNMDGLELCKKIRAAQFDRYIYIIMLTAKDNKRDLIEAIDSGADDFISKPLNIEELRVKIRAGERILKLENELLSKNIVLHQINQQLNKACFALQTDLDCAAKLQQSLLPKLPDANKELNGVQFSSLFIPSKGVGGDIFNVVELEENHVAFYLVDVAGHGVLAAMLTVTINKLLSPFGRILQRINFDARQKCKLISPDKVASELNQRFLIEDDNDVTYFTMIYGLINTENGLVSLVQAGHPYPLYLTQSGCVKKIGEGGFPIGMFANVEYDLIEFTLQIGERLVLYSDGITECTNVNKKSFSEARLIEVIQQTCHLTIDKVTDELEKELIRWSEGKDFDDDVSCLLLERIEK